MLLIRQPTEATLRRFLAEQRGLELSYDGVGATADEKPPSGYRTDRTRVELGNGEEAFAAAKEALSAWRQLQLAWIGVWPRDAAIRTGELVAVIARPLGLYWLQACQIVYQIDDDKPAHRRFGFAYGTLPSHAAAGEERFLVEMDATNTVWFAIYAFSKPRHPLARLGYPYLRHLQRRFGRQSAAAMRQTVNAASRA